MNEITLLFAQPWAERLGWALVQFIWQGAAIAALFAATRGLIADARWRYVLACLAMAAMIVAPVATFVWTAPAAPPAARASALDALASVSGAPAAISAPLVSAIPWMVMAWLAGVALFSARMIASCVSVAHLRAVHARPAPAEWQQTLDALLSPLGVTRAVRLLVSARVDVPAVVGWLRPVVLAPLSALTGLDPALVRALLAHELAHIRRNDYLVNLVQGFAEAALFYHPAVWWISSQIRAERELCCDDLAVAACGDVLTYARALAELEAIRPPRVSLAIAADGGSLLRRIARLIEPARPAGGTGAAWALSLLLLLGAGALAIRAQAPAGHGADPTLDRSEVWMDTVKQGDMTREVRGLGRLTSSTTAELKIAEMQIKELQPGQRVVIDFRGPSLAAGRVTRIRPGVSNGVVTVDVQVEPLPSTVVTPPAEVDGTIEIGRLTNVVHVGRSVSARADSEGYLYRVEPGGNQAVRVKVVFGKSSVNQIEIRSGLQPGDRVILSDIKGAEYAQRVYLK
jgi:beta-lactamase regulating signal transducer with metallopeptidase domain